MVFTDADLSRFIDSPHLCWVQDIDCSRVIWANSAALIAFKAESAEEFYARDVSPLSAASRTRLETYRRRVADGSTYQTQWNTFINARTPLPLLATISAFMLADKRLGLFFEAEDIRDSTCAESLRMLEAFRQSSACFALFALNGWLLECNATMVREFGVIETAHTRSNGQVDVFLTLFENAADAERIRATAIAIGEFRGRVRLKNAGTVCWHLMIVITILDPVDGERILHVEAINISNEVGAEIRARDAELLLQQIADEMPQPIAYVGLNREFGFANRTFASWVGKSRDEIVGKSIEKVVGPDALLALSAGLPKIEVGVRHYYERRAKIDGMGERWIGVDVIPHQNDSGIVQGGFVFGRDIHALKLAEAGRIESEQQLQLIADSLPVAVVLFDLELRVVFANRPLGTWFGTSYESLVGRHALEVFGKAIVDDTRQALQKVVEGESATFRREASLLGKTRWIDVILAPFCREPDVVSGIVAVYSDVTKRVSDNLALNATRDAFARHLANTPLAVVQLDETLKVVQWTGSAAQTFGWVESETEGRRIEALQLFEAEMSDRLLQELEKLRLGVAERFTTQLRARKKDGTLIYCEWFGSILRGVAGDVSYFLLVQDVSARVSAEHHLQYIASHDVLTGLANRTQFQERLRQEVLRARRHDHRIGIFLIDLDRFKYVNESLGHTVGDVLLQGVAARLTTLCGDGDLVARTGGDEFMLLMELDDAGHAGRISEEIRRATSRPMKLGDQEVFVTMSIGISVFPEDAQTETELIKNADWALYRAKDAGRNGTQFYSRTLAGDVPSRLSLETELRRVVEYGQLELHYQPKQSLANGRITGVEALVRWRHPVKGLIQPDQFIALAEETGLIIGIGAWVCQEACDQAARWRAQFGTSPQIAINLSPMQLSRRELAAEILAQLQRAGLPGNTLMVEVTETGVVSDPYLATLTLETLRAHGVQSAMDDFGTGYSSLMQLKRLPIDALKIDSSFVRDVVTDRDDAAIIQAIIGLGRSLDLRTIAEGVETPEQMSALLKYGCDEIQGYFLSRPVNAVDYAAVFFEK